VRFKIHFFRKAACLVFLLQGAVNSCSWKGLPHDQLAFATDPIGCLFYMACEGVEVKLHPSLRWHQVEVTGQLRAPAALSLRRSPPPPLASHGYTGRGYQGHVLVGNAVSVSKNCSLCDWLELMCCIVRIIHNSITVQFTFKLNIASLKYFDCRYSLCTYYSCSVSEARNETQYTCVV
jgi:hypothetical protein